MIGFAQRVLRWLRVLPPFSKDDVINASIEDTARDHDSVVQQLHEAFYKRLHSNELLRRAIHTAKRRTHTHH